jgi:carbon-monoxide dehydrogenase medium subunit
VGAVVTLDASGSVAAARAAYISVGPTPVLVELTGTADWTEAGELAAAAVDPEDDIHATAAYRRHLVRVLTARACAKAADAAEAAEAVHE